MERYEKYKDSGIEWIGEIPDDVKGSSLAEACERDKKTYKFRASQKIRCHGYR